MDDGPGWADWLLAGWLLLSWGADGRSSFVFHSIYMAGWRGHEGWLAAGWLLAVQAASQWCVCACTDGVATVYSVQSLRGFAVRA